MIGWGVAIGSEPKYRRFATPGLERVAAAEEPLFEVRGADCIFRAYNEILDRASALPGLEALVILHEDVELLDARLPDKLRHVFRDPLVALAGPIGGVGVSGIDWWNCERGVGAIEWEVLDPVEAFGTDLITTGGRVGPGGEGEVDSLDGLLLAFSPWAIANLRFDEALGPGFHGYDVDICFQARERGRAVRVIATECAHYNDTRFPYRVEWKRAYTRFRRKWEERWPLPLPETAPWDDADRAIARGELPAQG